MGAYRQQQGTWGEEARRACLIWADLPEEERHERGLKGGQTERAGVRASPAAGTSCTKTEEAGLYVAASSRTQPARGENIQARKVGGKGQINRAFQAVRGLRCLASPFTLDLGSSQGPLSVVEQRSKTMKAEFQKVCVTASRGADGRASLELEDTWGWPP